MARWRRMLSSPAMITTTAKTERELRQRALTQAAELFRAEGSAAIAVVLARAKDRSKTVDERRFDRLTLLEIERLDRVRVAGRASNALALWKPARFSLAGIAALFGIGKRRSKRRQ